jgi:PPK2 family polyphosphate:nucleotide phosphotransferase
MFADRFRVDPTRFRLKDCDPADTAGLTADAAKADLGRDLDQMFQLQDRFYAWKQYALLIVIQAPDAGGKDGVVKHVMTGLNPAGCHVHAFGPPSSTELAHDFLWRCVARLPERGSIGVFNRSYYEEVLIVRVHPGLLAAQDVAPAEAGELFWERRLQDIVNFERYLTHNRTRVVKFFLNISRQEQKRRLLARLEDPEKFWKFSPADVEERRMWDDYQAAYEAMLRGTSTAEAPWHVVPADHKWFTRLAVAKIVVETLQDLDPRYPAVSGQRLGELKRFRDLLEKEE